MIQNKSSKMINSPIHTILSKKQSQISYENTQDESSNFNQNQTTPQQYLKQIEQYRRINAQLKRKIQARDRKLQYLFCLDQMSKSAIPISISNKSQVYANSSNTAMNREGSELSTVTVSQQKKDVCHTDLKDRLKYREKQNRQICQNQNIFKDKDRLIQNLSLLQKQKQKDSNSFKLPALQRKNIFLENPQHDSGFIIKPRIVRVSIEKLVPLRHQDVRKKFQSKFK